jgi:hypothetical protein
MKKSKFLVTKPLFTILLFLFSLFLFSYAAIDYPEEVLKTKNSITGKRLVSYIDFLASAYCRGRETGEKGMDVAMKYIATVLKGEDLEPAGEFGSYFQSVRLKKVSLSEEIFLEIEERRSGVALIKEAKLEWDYLPVYISAEKEVTAPLVFAGYGITAPEHKYDDYTNLNARGKVVLVMRHEPKENDPESPFEGIRLSNHGTLLSKILNAQKHGAVGILFATDPLNHKELTPSATQGTRWPSLIRERMKDEEDFKFMKFSPLMRIVGADFGVQIPAVAIDGKLADYLLGDEHSLIHLQEDIDGKMMPRSFPITDKKITLAVNFKNESVDAFNILAKVEGSDSELKDEVVIVGAHYDHVGKDNRGRVYGGADDNASGSAGVMELARAFQSLKEKPKRSILFILFTAEEKGLYGARWYVDNPIFPLEKTVAMINLDMIGRNDVDQMSLIGRFQYPKLFTIIDTINRESVNFDLNFAVEEFIRQSDHFPFMRTNIPTVFFNSGMHETLHRPEDTADRIIPEKVQKATQLVFLSLWKIANLPPGTSLK